MIDPLVINTELDMRIQDDQAVKVDFQRVRENLILVTDKINEIITVVNVLSP